jgi:hypothetical protein
MTAGIVLAIAGILGILLTWHVARATDRAARETFRSIVTSPATDVATGDRTRVRIGAVFALDDEMLIELRPVSRRGEVDEGTVWVHTPTNVAAIITLSSWRDSNAVVELHHQTPGVRLVDDQARVSLTRARAELAS